MIEYYIVFFLALLAQLYPVKSNYHYKRRLFLTFFPLFMFGALRVDFGNDYSVYKNYFESINDFQNIKSVDRHMEIGFAWLNFLMPNFRSLLILTSLLMCGAYATLFYKIVKPSYLWFAVFLLFLSGDKTIFFQLSAMRNGIVVSFLTLSLGLIQNRKIFSFALITLFSSLFHTSALFFFPLAYIVGSNTAFTRKYILQWIIITLLTLTLSVLSFLEYITFLIEAYFERYVTVIKYMKEAAGQSNGELLAVVSSLFMLITIFYYSIKTRLNPIENSIFKIALLFLISFMLGPLNARMSQYYIVFFIITSTAIFEKWNKKLIRDFYVVLTTLFFGYGFFKVWMGSQWFAYKDYHSLLGKYLLNLD